ncbi:flavin reductase [Leucobacter allii]|uniref:Flavin reductase n=1 Tax=Leucobacter allii TaxID=2932247 RepID=A0ABY4FKT6_9MICO|nr:flavin reductase [Leucobacter allii]UOQ56878.1 flavin reductase [Leucobacter allii]
MSAAEIIEQDAPSKGEFRDVMGRFASGVTVITTHENGTDFGAAVSAVSSLSDEPPMLLVCLNVSSTTGQAVKRTGVFAVNVLAEDSAPLAYQFASRGDDKFSSVAFERGEGDVPLISGSIAHFECEVQEAVRGGTHFVFLARVRRVSSTPGNPLAYFRGSFGRMEMNADAVALRAVRDYVVARVDDVAVPLDAEGMAAALDLEVGRTFSALIALAGEGLVKRSGTVFEVEPVPDRVLYDYYSAKLSIELGVAAQTVGRVSVERLAELRRLMEATLEHVDGDRFTDPEAWVVSNAEFHEYLVGLAGSVILDETYRGLQLRAVERRAITATTRATAELLEDHRAIVAGYEAGNVGAVLATLQAHAHRAAQTRAALVG